MTAVSESSRDPLIIGGGIGGLTLAIALARQGIGGTLLERGAFGDPSGAGIQLGANAVKRLRALGLLEGLARAAFRPEAIRILDAASGRAVTTLPLGASFERRFGAPYLTLHRADLASTLLQAAQSLEGWELRSDIEIAGIAAEAPDGIVALSSQGERFAAPYAIGADGLWSVVRSAVAPKAQLRFTGHTAARAMLPRRQLPPPFDEPIVTLWLGTGCHLVTYPVSGGEQLNIVFCTQGGSAERGWNETQEPQVVMRRIRRWAPAARCLLEQAPAWRRWSLYRLQGAGRWSDGNLVLMGDAAHPVLPYLAQGAALAIEDAVCLAGELSRAAGDHRAAFRRYEAERSARASRVAGQSARLGRAYHLPPPLSTIRNAVLARRDPQAALGGLAWLYGA